MIENSQHKSDTDLHLTPVFPTQSTLPAQTLDPTPAKTQLRRDMPGAWPFDESDNLLAVCEPDLPKEEPDTTATSLQTRRNSVEVLRMAGAWPLVASREMLFEPIAKEGCVLS